MDNLRYYSKLYIHGHSVGGTNPSLIEAMSARALVLVHRNRFNLSVLKNKYLSFKTKEDLKQMLLNDSLIKKKNMYLKDNIDVIKKEYSWKKIINDYESFFVEILNKKQTLSNSITN